MKNTPRTLLITILAFGAYYLLDEAFFPALRSTINESIHQISISHILAYLILGIPLLIGIILLHKGQERMNSLGLNRPVLRAMLIALLLTLPMFIGYAIVYQWNTEISIDKILLGVVCAAFFEELYFRGFLFGQIFRYSRIGFIPAVLIGAVLFAIVHLYQSQELSTSIGVFAITFMGGILFAWLYAEWDYNLWVPIFLHAFMNLSWMMFDVADNALGDLYANIFRNVTIALSIILTIVYKRRKGLALEVNRSTIWMKK